MCTNDENPHLVETRMSLFHVECHVRGAVTDLVVPYGNTHSMPLMLWNNSMQAISVDETEKAGSFKETREKDGVLGVCSQQKCLGSHPLERQKTSVWDMIERCCHHGSLVF